MTVSEDRGRVLIVYPPGATARGMADALASDGVASDTADNVYRAVSAFTANRPDLVVLGLAGLDDRDLEAIRVLREISPEVYLLLAFPSGHRDRAVKALALGADSYILEPFYLEEFLDIVRRGLQRAGRGRETRLPEGGGEGLERLAGAVAHAINNPLQILELLLTDEEGGPDREDFRQETRRIGAVVKELLAFSRRTEAQRTNVDVNALIREAVPAADASDRRVRHELTAELPAVAANPELLRAALAAFGALADARGAGGRLVVRTEVESGRPGGPVRVEFVAPELLLSPEEVRDLFLPFAGPLKGEVGLAGATARAVVETLGGELRVSSREGRGTELAARLPAVAGAPRAKG